MPNLWPFSHIFAALTAHDVAESRPARCRADPLDLAGNPCFPALLCQRIGSGRHGPPARLCRCDGNQASPLDASSWRGFRRNDRRHLCRVSGRSRIAETRRRRGSGAAENTARRATPYLKCVSDTHVLEFVAKIDILQRSENQARKSRFNREFRECYGHRLPVRVRQSIRGTELSSTRLRLGCLQGELGRCLIE